MCWHAFILGFIASPVGLFLALYVLFRWHQQDQMTIRATDGQKEHEHCDD